MSKKKIPFDLNRAMAGDKIVTRNGREFVFGCFNPKAGEQHRVLGWIGGGVRSYYKNGRVYSNRENPEDLFMKPPTANTWQLWVRRLREPLIDGIFVHEHDVLLVNKDKTSKLCWRNPDSFYDGEPWMAHEWTDDDLQIGE